MAAPHLAGVVALIWSAAPALMGDIDRHPRPARPDRHRHATDLSCGGTPENNNVFGEGRVDAFAATEQAPRGPTGTLTGTVTAAGGGPLANATITVEGPTKRRTLTDAMGAYSLLLPVGDYAVTASAFGHVTQTVSGVAITEGATTTLTSRCRPRPRPTSRAGHRQHRRAAWPAPRSPSWALPSRRPSPTPPANTASPAFPQGTYDVRAEGSRCLDSQTKTLVVDGDEVLDFTLAERTDAFGHRCKDVAASFIDAETVLPLTGDLVTLEGRPALPLHPLRPELRRRSRSRPRATSSSPAPGPVNYNNERHPDADPAQRGPLRRSGTT